MDTRCGILVLVCILSVFSPSFAHADDDDKIKSSDEAKDSLVVSSWTADIIARILASQTGTQNWVEDGRNAMNSTLRFDIKLKQSTEKWEQVHESRFAMGVVKLDTLDFRKADDEIRIRSTFRYQGDGFFKHLNPTIATDFSTQFAAGFNYNKNPFDDGRPAPVKVSGFFAPATFAQTIGLTYAPAESFRSRFGVGAKQTIVGIERVRPLYNLPVDQSTRVEMGFESRTQIDKKVFENVHLKSSLGLFAAFNKPDLPDLLWENQVNMKVNKWLGVNMEFKALYDRDISQALQLKESFSLGIVYDLI